MNSRLFYSSFSNLFLLLLIVTISSCSFLSSPDKGIKSEELEISFKHKDWQRIEADMADDAYKNTKNGNILIINSLCRKYDRTTLEQLTDNILAGLSDSSIIDRKSSNLFKRSSLRTIASGTLDGVKTHMIIEVVKKDRCIYDIVLITSDKKIASAHINDFEQLLNTMKVGND